MIVSKGWGDNKTNVECTVCHKEIKIVDSYYFKQHLGKHFCSSEHARKWERINEQYSDLD